LSQPFAFKVLLARDHYLPVRADQHQKRDSRNENAIYHIFYRLWRCLGPNEAVLSSEVAHLLRLYGIKRLDSANGVSDINAETFKPLRMVLLVSCLEVRKLRNAGRSGYCPEIQQQILPAILGQFVGLALHIFE
jgi:hypothetical protein